VTLGSFHKRRTLCNRIDHPCSQRV
jgi:hypothetical protein